MPLIETKGAASAQGFGEFAKTGEAVYIESCFSTYLYTGNGSTQTITNGIDLSTKGGLVWLKARNLGGNHYQVDTARGNTKYLASNSTTSQMTFTDALTAFTSTGFTLGADTAAGDINGSGYVMASWTFRKQPKFFDVVTFTGNGSANQRISHSLGSVPGCIIIKRTGGTSSWFVYHRTEGINRYGALESDAAFFSFTNFWGTSAPTASDFGVSNTAAVSGNQYVAYLFAHNAGGFGLTGTDNVISCGSFTTDGSGYSPDVNLGYEPQWVLLKPSGGTGNWLIVDTMRGWVNPAGTAADDANLRPNKSDAEATNDIGWPTATGFNAGYRGTANNAWIYIAIRRGPMKTPTSGTSVYETLLDSAGTGTLQTSTASFPLDMQFNTLYSQSNATYNNQINDRLRGIGFEPSFSSTPKLTTASTEAESTSVAYLSFKGNGRDVTKGSGWGSTVKALFYNFRRAPGFFDVVCYTGTGSATTFNHNLGVAPELIITKMRSSTRDWGTGWASLGWTARGPALNSTETSFTTSLWWNNTAPTTSVFTVGTSPTTNGSGDTYVAYLFASCPGVSKVFSFTGNGSSQTINCGFTGGSRLVLIKRTDSTGNWVIFDSARGIVAGNDPALYLNSTAAEVTGVDAIDTDSTGFIVNQETTFNLNVNNATYIGLAIS